MASWPNTLWSRSFELVYYDPSPQFKGRTSFRDPDHDLLDTQQRMCYLTAYAELLRRMADLGDHPLSSDVVSDLEADQVTAQIKERPLPCYRQVIPLHFWRWKLQGAEAQEWITPGYDDRLWNELETPAVLDMGRAMLLRCTVNVEQAEQIMLDIEAIHDEYDLWMNGQPVCHHRGYEPHTVDVTACIRAGQENTVAIRITEKPGYQIGIAGAIQIVGTHSTFIEEIFVKPIETVEGCPARVHILASIRNTSRHAFSGTLAVRFSRWFPEEDGTVAVEVPTLSVTVGSDQTQELVQECLLQGLELWWPERPRLYKVEAILNDEAGRPVDDLVDTVGIRTIQQHKGRLYLNGRRFFLRSFGHSLGFAPAANFHSAVCPPDVWIVRDLLLARRANANAVRLHPWGFSGKPGQYNEYGWPTWGLPTDGTNYGRIADIADQLGICLIWVTRHWTMAGYGFREHYREEDMEQLLVPSLKRVRNHPSIVAYEGMNEVGLLAHQALEQPEEPGVTQHLLPQEVETLVRFHQHRVTEFCAEYIRLVNSVDDSRLLCPDSMWGPGYQRNPQWPTVVQHEDESVFTMAENVYWDVHDYSGWYTDFKELYTYNERFWPDDRARVVMLTECGAEAMPDWERYRGLSWRNLWLNSGQPCARIEQARLGRPLRPLRDSEAHLSQAYQGLCIQQTVNFGRASGCDGININLIADGLAEGNYHKGVCDLYRHAKLGYFAARMAYQPTLVTGMDGDFVLSDQDALHLVLVNEALERVGRRATVRVEVKRLDGSVVDATERDAILAESGVVPLGDYQPSFPGPGLYQIEYTVEARG